VLNDDLQAKRPFQKWKQRAKAGIYLGKSPHHARNVALNLDRETGLVSPQFHVTFDPSFDTVKDITVKSLWQLQAGFVTQRESKFQLEKARRMGLNSNYEKPNVDGK
jgi:hypothetical protein